MSNCIRKLRRNKLKQELGTNKIKDFWHTQNDTLEQRLKRGMEKENGKKV